MNRFKIEMAIDNNKALYQSVFKANDLELKSNQNVYFLLKQSPPLYSNLVTRQVDAPISHLIEEIDEVFKRECWPEWSIKDSFNVLELGTYGFEKLFEAQWFHLDKKSFQPKTKSFPIKFQPVTNQSELEDWIRIWGEGIETGKKIFTPHLIEDTSIQLVSYSSTQTSGVALLNQGHGEPVGISNFFPEKETTAIWSSLVSFIFENYNANEVVGYEGANVMEKVSSLGIDSIGPLSVWLKKPNK